MAFSNVIREMLIDIRFRVNSAPIKEAENRISNMKQTIQGLQRGAGMAKIQSSMHSLMSTAQKAAVGFGAMTAGAGFFLNEAGQFNKTRIAFETMTGSVEKGRKLLEELHVFATETPFSLKDVEQNSAMLIGMGIETEKVIPTMKALGDVAAGINRPLGMVALNFGQIKTRGVLMGTELRDFARQGVPIIEQLAKTLSEGAGKDLTGADIQEMTSKRLITFEDVEQAFIDMTGEGGRFFDLMFKQAKTWPVMISNFLIQLKILSREVGQELLPQAKAFLKTFMDWIRANKEMLKTNLVKFFKAWFKALKDIWKFFKDITPRVKGFVKALGGLENVLKGIGILLTAIVAIQLTSLIGNVVVAIGTMIGALMGVVPAAVAVNAAMGFLPVLIGIAIALIGLLAQDVYGFFNNQDSLIGRVIDRWKDWKKIIKDVINILAFSNPLGLAAQLVSLKTTGKTLGAHAEEALNKPRGESGKTIGSHIKDLAGHVASIGKGMQPEDLLFQPVRTGRESVNTEPLKGEIGRESVGMVNNRSNITVNQNNEIAIKESVNPLATAEALSDSLNNLDIMNSTPSNNAVSVKGL